MSMQVVPGGQNPSGGNPASNRAPAAGAGGPQAGPIPGINQTRTPVGEQLDKLLRLYGEGGMLVMQELAQKGIEHDASKVARGQDMMAQVQRAIQGLQQNFVGGGGGAASLRSRQGGAPSRPDGVIDTLTTAPQSPVSGQGDQHPGGEFPRQSHQR